MSPLLPRARYIQLIHIGKSTLKMDDETYRSVLRILTKKESCSDMTQLELDKVLQHLKTLGFIPIASKKRSGKKLSPSSRDKDTKSQLDKLRQLWIVMAHDGYLKDGSEQALLNWSKGQAKRFNKNVSVERLEWLKPDMLHRLIEQLKQWYKRCEVSKSGR